MKGAAMEAQGFVARLGLAVAAGMGTAVGLTLVLKLLVALVG